jgi:chromosome segregation ATPase
VAPVSRAEGDFVVTIETFIRWRDELSAELAVAQADLATSESDLTEATKKRDAVAARRNEIDAALRSLEAPLHPRIAARTRPMYQEFNSAEGAATQARERGINYRRQIEDLAEALAQVELLLPTPEPAAETEASAAA